jgi:methionyl-tRNA formyltransferase
MDKLRIFCCGYREWALWLFSHLPYEKQIVKTPETLDMYCLEFDPDVILLVGWSWIVPKAIHNYIPTLCLHPSPLPKYRGGSPLQHQIINGEEKGAITLFRVTDEIDAGNILGQVEISLKNKLNNIFGEIVEKGIVLIEDVLQQYPDFTGTPQVGETTVYKRRTPEESELKPDDFQFRSAKQIHDFVRALDDPYPNAFIVCGDGKKIYLKETSLGT